MDPASKPRPTLGAYIVAVHLFCVPSFGYSESPGILIIPQITGALLVAYALFDMFKTQKISIPLEIRVYGFLGLWAAITFLGGISSEELRPLGSLIKVIATALACAQLIKNEIDFVVAMRVFVISVLFVYFLNKDALRFLRIADKLTESDRFAGTMMNANTAAIYSVAVLWSCIHLWILSKRKLMGLAFWIIPIGISLLIIYYSGSKKGLIGIGLFAILFARLLHISKNRSSLRKSLILLVSVALIILTALFIYTSPFFSRLEQLYYGTAKTDINRYEFVREAINVWLMNGKTFIMGVGYDNFRLVNYLGDYAHSTPFELLASNGIIGFSLFMGFLFLLYYKFVFLYKKAKNWDLKSIFFSAIIFLSIYSFFIVGAVLHESRELGPILGSLAGYGQCHFRKIGQ